MKEKLLQLKELLEEIIVEFDLKELNMSLFNGEIEIHSESLYHYGQWFRGNKKAIRTSIDNTLTIAKGNTKITDNLEDIIRLLGD